MRIVFRHKWGNVQTPSEIFVARGVGRLVADGVLLALVIASVPNATLGSHRNDSERDWDAVLATSLPAIALILNTEDESFCGGTLIDSRTVLTAAHCVCADGATTYEECDARSVEAFKVFFDQAGTIGVTDVVVDPGYEFARKGDLALLRLESTVSVPPIRIGSDDSVSPIQEVAILGFGRTPGRTNEQGGIKRWATTRLAPCCPDIPGDSQICWENLLPRPSDQRQNTCEGDSGGAVLKYDSAGVALIGVVSGGEGASCLPHAGLSSFATSAAHSQFLKSVVSASSPSEHDRSLVRRTVHGRLDERTPSVTFPVEVRPGTGEIRVALTSRFYSARGELNDFDLTVRRVRKDGGNESACTDESPWAVGFCSIASPEPGVWAVMVRRVVGSGRFDLTLYTSRPPFEGATELGKAREPGLAKTSFSAFSSYRGVRR